MRDITLEDTIHIDFTSRQFSDGVPTVLAGTPVLSVLEENNATPITAGVSVSVDRASVVGLNMATVVATAANGYEAGKGYSVYISTGTVGGVSVVGEVVGQFTIGASAAAVDLANGTDGLGVLKSELDGIQADTENIQSRIPAALVSGRIDAAIDGTGFEDAAVDKVWNEALSGHQTAGTAGEALTLAGYAGPHGPGVYIDDGAANTSTVTGTDGTPSKPVSTLGAGRTLADALGIRTYYFTGSDLTLAATHEDWLFVGLGEVTANILNLGSQDVDRSMFRGMTIEGTQGGTQRIETIECAIQDPGAGDTTLHIFAQRCGLVDRMQVDTSADNVFDSCYSLVAGTAAPVIEATGAAGTITVRHFSGGIEFESLSASHNISVETDGQVIFNANCNVNATVVVRGLSDITDNTAGMNDLTQVSMVNMTKINDEVLDVMNVDTFAEPGQEAPAATNSLVGKIGHMFKAYRNRKTQTATEFKLFADDGTTVDQKSTDSDDGTTADKGELVSGP